MSAEAERALAAIEGFDGACLGSLLADGPASRSWRVEQGGVSWVLRLDKPEAAQLGLDRRNERAVAAAVAGAGLTPPYRHFEPERGVALRPFVEGQSWTNEDLLDSERLGRLAAALRALHGLPPVGRAFDPLGAARRYARQIGSAGSARALQRSEAAWAAVPAGSRAPVLCHNDLVAENILETPGGVRLIDWEYAGLGDALFDLAVVLEHHGLGSEASRRLLKAYLRRDPTDPERARLRALKRFYAALLELWRLRTAPL